MNTALENRSDTQSDRPIIPDLQTLLAHPEYPDESLATIGRMAPNIEAYLSKVLVEPPTVDHNQIGASIWNRLSRKKNPVTCACGKVETGCGVCKICFDRDLEALRQIRPEMEAAIEAARRIGNSSRQMEAHILAYNAKIPATLRRAVEESLKIWIFEELGVYVQIWGSDISGDGFRRETLKATKVAVPSEGLRFLALLMANNSKLPRRDVAPWVYISGLDPYLVPPFDVGIMCGADAIEVAVHKWD